MTHSFPPRPSSDRPHPAFQRRLASRCGTDRNLVPRRPRTTLSAGESHDAPIPLRTKCLIGKHAREVPSTRLFAGGTIRRCEPVILFLDRRASMAMSPAGGSLRVTRQIGSAHV